MSSKPWVWVQIHQDDLVQVLWIRIRLFLGLLDPDPLVRGTDPDPGPSIIKQK
jgi:hypothetical protein